MLHDPVFGKCCISDQHVGHKFLTSFGPSDGSDIRHGVKHKPSVSGEIHDRLWRLQLLNFKMENP